MASGTTASALTVLPSGYVTNIFIDSVQMAGKVDLGTLEIEESGNQQIGSCSFTIIDRNNSVTVKDKAFVQVADSTGQLFKGFVDGRTPQVMAIGRRIDVMAHGIESLLDTIIVVENVRKVDESDKARLQYFLATYGSQGLYNNSLGSTDNSKIQVLRASMPNQKFKNMTLRNVVESILGLASETSDYYIDNIGRLHTFDATHPEGDSAPYVVRVGTPAADEVAPEEPVIEFDSQGLINDYQVRAKNKIYDVRRADTASIALYGRYAAFVDAPDADTQEKANRVGDAALKDNAAPKARGSFRVTTPYDLNGSQRWKVGQMVTLHSTQHGLSGAQSRIVGLRWEYLSGDGTRSVHVSFGGDRLRLRSGGTGNNVPAQQTGSFISGDIG